MVVQLRPLVPFPGPDPYFARLLVRLRRQRGLSQNQLARLAGVDPAYVNRIERERTGPPSRFVTICLWEALEVGPDDRERLLVAAGHCPQTILDAGGWDAYLARVTAALLGSVPPAGPVTGG